MTSLNVTLRQLTLGVQDATTGLYQKAYVDSVIKMVIQPRGAVQVLTSVGEHARVDCVGFTDVAVVEGDQITDLNGRSFTVLTSQPVKIGDRTVYYEVGLAGYAPNENAAYVETCMLFILVTDGGTTDPAEGIYVKRYGESVTITHSAESGYTFKEWQFDDGDEETGASTTFTVSRNMAVMAVFMPTPLPPLYSGIMTLGAGFSNNAISETVEVDDHDVREEISESVEVDDHDVRETISESVEVDWAEGTEKMKQIICWRSGANLTAGTTQYVKPVTFGASEGVVAGMQNPDATIHFPLPSGYINYLYAVLDQAPGVGEDVQVTLMQSGGATALDFTISGAAAVSGYDGGAVDAMFDYYMDMRVISSAGSAATKVTVYAWWYEA